MLRTSSKVKHSQRLHRACRLRIHANEPATAVADQPRLIQCILTQFYKYRNRHFQARRSEMVLSTTVKLCERVELVLWYIAIFCSRPQGKRTIRDCRKGEVDPSIQLYSESMLIAPIGGTFARRSCDAQY